MNVAILPYKENKWVFRDAKESDLVSQDYQILEKLLERCIKEYNKEQEKLYNDLMQKHPENTLDKEDYLINLKNYKRQYVVVMNDYGEKVVWINCFCGDFDFNWKKTVIIVMDGGNCFFNLRINLTKGEYYLLMVNGQA